MMLTKEDVERIVSNELRGLVIRVVDSDQDEPNSRTIVLEYNHQEISRTSFDIGNPDE